MTPTLRRWRAGALAVVGTAALLPVGVARCAHESHARALAARSARSAAAYLALVTPAGPAGVRYDLAQLLVRARGLDELPEWHGRLEIYLGTAPLVHAAGSSLAPGTLAELRREAEVRWADGAALVPLFDREGWDVVGAVEARVDLPEGARARWIGAALVAACIAGALAARTLGAARPAVGRAVRRYAVAAGVLGLIACADVRAAARDATDLWLTDTRVLLEEAAARLPAARSAPTSLAAIGRDGEIVTGDSAGPGVRRRDVAGLPRAAVAVRLAPGHWAELRRAPEEAGALGWLAAAFGLAVLGPLGVAGAAWGARASTRPRYLRETVAAWGFLAPSALHLAVFSFGPIGFALYLSLHRWGVMDPVRRFVGLANYTHLLGDPLVWTSLRNTMVYALYVPVSLAVALAVALALNRRSGSARVLRTVMFLPCVPSLAAVALVWQELLQPAGGPINRLLSLARLGSVDWLGDPRSVIVALMIVSLWVQLGCHMTVFLAGLQRIPQAYLDAARVDGAGAWQRFWRVTFPLLRPVSAFLLVTGVIGACQVFTFVYVLTGGGPLHASDVVAYRLYETAWEFRQFGSASALALLVSLLLGGLAWAQVRALRARAAHA